MVVVPGEFAASQIECGSEIGASRHTRDDRGHGARGQPLARIAVGECRGITAEFEDLPDCPAAVESAGCGANDDGPTPVDHLCLSGHSVLSLANE